MYTPRAVLYPVGAALLIVVFWAFAIRAFQISPNLLPAPDLVIASLFKGLMGGRLWYDIWVTLFGMVTGYVIGSVVAIVLAILLVESRILERFLLTYIVAFQAIPKISLAPLMFLWLGFGAKSMVTLVAVTCFYPVFVNTAAGLRSVNPDFLDMLRAFSASRWHILWHVKIPAALPFIFTGLQLGVVFSLLGEIVMEFLAGDRGLGFVIQNSANTLDMPLNFAALVLLAVMGTTASLIVRRIGRRVVFWEAAAEVPADG